MTELSEGRGRERWPEGEKFYFWFTAQIDKIHQWSGTWSGVNRKTTDLIGSIWYKILDNFGSSFGGKLVINQIDQNKAFTIIPLDRPVYIYITI